MTGRSNLHLPLLICVLLLVCMLLLAGCGSTPWVSSMQVIPASQTLQGVGATVQYKAMGTLTNREHPQTYKDVTNQVAWSSSVESVATISSVGLATGVSAGTTTITATAGGTAATATLVVGNGTGSSHDLTSLTIIPGDQIVNLVGETAQYIAIGSFTGTPAAQDMTNQVTWSSSDVRIATVNAAGLATAVGNCGGQGQVTTITALATSGGVAIAGTSDFTVDVCGTNNLPSLTVYDFGQGTGNVVSSPGGISCGSGGGCTGHFVLGAPVTLTASPSTGSKFGGFSANCVPVVPDPSSCTTANRESDALSCVCNVTMTDNATVGAVFNLAQ